MIRFLIISMGMLLSVTACSQKDSTTMNTKYNPLTQEEAFVILNKGTERPFSGIYEKHTEQGTYTCKHCDTKLFESTDKFDAHCGWPSFDDAIEGAVKEVPDADGSRTEIVCSNCGGHLGHVFRGEGFTGKNTRHCVNSISLNFVPEQTESKVDTVYFGGGCFWGVEYYLNKMKGVISTEVGYTGGNTHNPTYEQVCTGKTGHAEVVKVVFDQDLISYRQLAKSFFELHDFTQVNRQGPDVGTQYRTEIFYTEDYQKQETEKLIEILSSKGYKVATQVTKAKEYYKAEEYHQDYYDHKAGRPYCHTPKKVF